MSENPDKNIEASDFEEILVLGGELDDLKREYKALRTAKYEFRIKEQERILARKEQLKTRLIYIVTQALINDPENARYIIEHASDRWEEDVHSQNPDFRAEVCGLLIKKKVKEGLYVPKSHEKVRHMDYNHSLEFIERRMRIVGKLVEAGYEEFNPYFQFIKDARSKLKVRETTFWLSTEFEQGSLTGYRVGLARNDFWNELCVYLAQKSAGEIGGVDRVQGEHRVKKEYMGERAGEFYDSIGSGAQIVEEVMKEGLKYDFRTIAFITALEEDLDIGTGQIIHYQHLGRFSRWRRTIESVRQSQKEYRPTIQQHKEKVSEWIAKIINMGGDNFFPEKDQEFDKKLKAIMELYPQYKYEDVEPKLPEEAWSNYEIKYEEIPADSHDECVFIDARDETDITPFEDSRASIKNDSA